MLVLPVAALLLLAAPQSQPEAPQPQFHESIEVRLHSIDVFVTDEKGVPVVGLEQEDFELLEDGIVQDVTNFAAYADAGASPGTAPRSATMSVAASAPPPTTYVFFIDDMALQGVTIRALESRLKALVSTLRPGDSATVIRPADALSLTIEFTSDRKAIANALAERLTRNKISGRRIGFEADWFAFESELVSVSSFEDGRNLANRYAGRVRRRARQRLGTLRAIIASIADRPGRKVVIAVTQSMPSRPGQEFFERHIAVERAGTLTGGRPDELDFLRSGRTELAGMLPASTQSEQAAKAPAIAQSRYQQTDLLPSYSEVARLASSSGIQLDIIRPDHDLPLRSLSPGVTESQGATGQAASALVPALWTAIENTNRAATEVTQITGGHDFRPNDVDRGRTDDLARDLATYYSLAYRATGGLDQVHRVEVRVRNRPELKVRSRREVERKTAPREFTDRVIASLVGGESSNDLGIAVRPASGNVSGSTRLLVEAAIPIDSLHFEKEGGVYKARYSAHYAIVGAGDQFATGAEMDRVMEIQEADWPRAQAKHWSHILTLNGQLGDAKVAVGIMDAHSERTGIAILRLKATPKPPAR